MMPSAETIHSIEPRTMISLRCLPGGPWNGKPKKETHIYLMAHPEARIKEGAQANVYHCPNCKTDFSYNPTDGKLEPIQGETNEAG